MQPLQRASGNELFTPWIMTSLYPPESSASAGEHNTAGSVTMISVEDVPEAEYSRISESVLILDKHERDPTNGPRGLVLGLAAGGLFYGLLATVIYYFRHQP